MEKIEEIEEIEDVEPAESPEVEPYVAPTLEELIEELRNLWANSFETVYDKMNANGDYWSADMQIEAHNRHVREKLDWLVGLEDLSTEEADNLYREIAR